MIQIYNDSRKGETFKCVSCNFEIDSDLNASINILQRGVYNHSSFKKLEQVI